MNPLNTTQCEQIFKASWALYFQNFGILKKFESDIPLPLFMYADGASTCIKAQISTLVKSQGQKISLPNEKHLF